MEVINPYALYIKCDAAMDYDPNNTGGIGFEIIFPESVNLENIREFHGKYHGANIERLELEAVLSGMEYVIKLFQKDAEILSAINTIIFVTDRHKLSDQERTNFFKIQNWKKNKWCSHEGKPIKNSDLLNKLDKTRQKLAATARSRVFIEYHPRKQNKVADKLAKAGKQLLTTDDSISIKGLKVGKRKFDGPEINYSSLTEKQELKIHIFLKAPVNKQWEINAEIVEGVNIGKKLKIYTDDKLATKLQRRHEYNIRIKKIFVQHIQIFRTLKKKA